MVTNLPVPIPVRDCPLYRIKMTLIRDVILARKGADKILSFRFTAAARACPQMEPALDEALSRRSDLTRIDAAATLASVIHGYLRVITFSAKNVEVPARRGMAGVDAIIRSQHHGVTNLADAVRFASAQRHDRLIVITDEQANGPVPAPVCERAYMINVSTERNAVGYGNWTRIDGFSENVLRFVSEIEALNAEGAD